MVRLRTLGSCSSLSLLLLPTSSFFVFVEAARVVDESAKSTRKAFSNVPEWLAFEENKIITVLNKDYVISVNVVMYYSKLMQLPETFKNSNCSIQEITDLYKGN